jgi:hypothetical protein
LELVAHYTELDVDDAALRVAPTRLPTRWCRLATRARSVSVSTGT